MTYFSPLRGTSMRKPKVLGSPNTVCANKLHCRNDAYVQLWLLFKPHRIEARTQEYFN